MPDPQPPTVTVVGSANVDLVVPVERRPAAGETVLGGRLRRGPGGKGANQAVAAARLGARVRFVGCVGDDEHGRMLRASLGDAGVGTALRITAAPTGVALILLSPDGDNSIVVSPGANGEVGNEDLDAAEDLLGATDVLLLQREIDPGVSAEAARRATGARVLLVLAPTGPVPAGLLAAADPLIVNESEARDLLAGRGSAEPRHDADGSPEPSGVALAVRLRGLGARSAVVTLGAAGAAWADSTGDGHVAAPPVTRVVDTTGAGDALAGALAWRLAAGDRLDAALATAVRAGSLAVTREGAQPSFATAEELAEAEGVS